MLVLAAALGTGAYRVAEERAVHHATTHLNEQRHEVLARAKALENEIATSRAGSVAPENVPSAPATPTAPPPSSRPFFDIVTFLRERPDLREIYLESSMAGQLLEQEERFRREMVRHDQRRAEISSQRRSEGWSSDDPRVAELRRREDELCDWHVRELLGDAGLQQYQDFTRLTPVRGLALELLQRTCNLDQLLIPANADELTRILARHAVNAQGRVDHKALDWDAALPEAQKVLTPPQFEQLQMMRQAADLQRELQAVEQRLKSPTAARDAK